MTDPREINIADLPFVTLQKRHDLPSAEGVYFLFEPEEDGDLTLIYVGQTGDFRRRWKRHEVMERLSAEKDYHIAYFEVSDASLLAIESYFIAEWMPLLNKTFAPVKMWEAGFYGSGPRPDLLAARQRKNRPR